MRIPFNQPYFAGKELDYIQQAHRQRHLSGDGPFTKLCHTWLEEKIGVKKALLTHSCTAALEMAAMLTQCGPGDEVIMPSYTFVSTANAFVLQGATPVFVDIRPDTLNIDETLIEAAITPRTKAIVVVHYAGVACEMDAIVTLAKKHKLWLIEDAAQAIGSTYKGKPLGSFGHLAALSFHETKNIISGEGGALLINDERFIEPATIIREKGTNRTKFLKGEVDKYTWVDRGSSFLPSDLIAAFLWAQLENFDPILSARRELWDGYHQGLTDGETQGLFTRTRIPAECGFNAHLYYLLLPTPAHRDLFLADMTEKGIGAIFHYVPLHDSPAGLRFSRTQGDLRHTRELSARLVRLPLWIGLREHQEEVILQTLKSAQKAKEKLG